ncbi:ABC exporter membrane fusion protein [Scytonema sp. NUACC21]
MKLELITKPKIGKFPILIAVTGLTATVVAVYSVLHPQPPTKSPSTIASATKNYVDSIAALGYLEPQGEIIHLSAPASTESARVDQLLVKVGDKVKAGQVIAILDNRARLQATLEIAEKQVKVAQARLAQVKAGAKKGDILAQDARLQQTKAELEGQINTQRATISNIKAQLQGEKNTQEATIGRLQSELSNAQSDCQRYQLLYQSGAISEQSRNNFCLKEKTNQKLLQEAQANLNLIITSRKEQIQEAQANLNRIIATQQRQIEREKATLDATEEIRSVDVQVASAEVQQAQANVQKAKADLALAYIRAPKDGQVLKVHSWSGEIISDRGIIELGQTDQMYVTAEVYETDIARVRIGQRATIASEQGIRDLEGTVKEIGLRIGRKSVLGTDPVADTDARVVEVKIALNSEDSEQVAGLTNMQVNVVINTSSLNADKKLTGSQESMTEVTGKNNSEDEQ